MSQKYTKEDFENARFAVHETGQAVAIRWSHNGVTESKWTAEDPYNSNNVMIPHSGSMAEEGWVPVPARPVVTESEIERAARAAWGYCARDTDRTFLEQLGVEVIKDPVPSDEEKLAELIDGHIKSKGITPESLARYLTLRGVKAPDSA